ncbi:MAG: hypothetical protein K6B14_03970 [Lachnospiraceae bacterium]|nr:hypothetical protein [Lachnospiraceae bacterium]
MDSAGSVQRDLFSKFIMAFNRAERETYKVDRLIPGPDELAEREKCRRIPTMTGRKRLSRGIIEEQLTEVEGIIDHLGTLTENVDDASQFAQMLADSEPVEGAEEIDIKSIIG